MIVRMGRPKLQASLLVALSATAAVVAGCAGASDVCGQPETATPWMVRPVLSEDKSCLLSISPDSVLVADRGGDMCSGAGIGYRVGPAIEPTPEIDATDGGVRIPVTAATSASAGVMGRLAISTMATAGPAKNRPATAGAC